MRETPRPQGTAGDAGRQLPQHRSGRAFAHTTGASGSGTPHRSDGRSPHTPRGARQNDPAGHPGTIPPVPRWPAFLVFLSSLLVLLALTTWQVVAEGPLLGPDERIGLATVDHGPTGLAELFADLGNTQVALPVLCCAIGYTLVRGGRREPLYAALAMAVVPLLVIPLKLWTDRRGPLTEATGYYPSGHTATSMVAYGAAALLLVPYLRRPWSWMVPVTAVLLTTATGAGLLLRGYHWPLDVLGSLWLGGLLLSCLWWFSRRSRRRSSSRTPSC